MDKQLHEAISAVAREEMELGPLFLALFSGELEAAKQASYDLWVCLCNQGQITPAALPSYGILREGLLTLPQELKVEILDILYQFAVGSSVPPPGTLSGGPGHLPGLCRRPQRGHFRFRPVDLGAAIAKGPGVSPGPLVFVCGCQSLGRLER